jgi:hypothetical protein
MVGSDARAFADLAVETGLSNRRRVDCQQVYRMASRGWERILRPHRRSPDAAKQNIGVLYHEATGPVAIYARVLRTTRFLEIVAAQAAEQFAWPRAFSLEMKQCGERAATWNGAARQLVLCYELAQDFAELYRAYGAPTPN